ncbi:MAG: response regulator [Nocardioides sp.]|uniref:response regulator n=1 Tax=Nocardioides sp. TaxID=35761 RepID=UPI003D6C0B18
MSSPQSSVKIKVAIVDDDPLVRSALGLMLGGQADIEVVGEATDGQEALALVRTSAPDVVLMDIRMPRINGLDATRRLLADARPSSSSRAPLRPPRVIVLTTFGADEYVVDALAAGADGFLLKDTPPPEIVAAIRTVAEGEPILSPKATRTLITRLRAEPTGDRAAAAGRRLEALTEREHEVALAVGRGLSNAEIAKELYLSIPTVKAHVSRLFDKLGATNRVQIAITVHDAGLV